MKTTMRMIVIAGAAVLTAAAAKAGGDPTGVWKLSSGKVTVEVAPCGPGFCGTIVALAKPLDKQGKPKRDKENPDEALRKRPLIGLQVLNDMQPDGNNRYSGTIYNADDGQTYASRMSLDGDVMNVKGCVIIICKNMKFVRVDSP